LQHYSVAKLTQEELMALPSGALQAQAPPDGFIVRRATMDDMPGLVKLYADAGDMSRTPAAVERPLIDRQIWLALKEDKVVSAALTNAETEDLAMIGGVYTANAWRGRGLSQAVCSALCTAIITAGRQPVLYWHNPTAGHVYAKLGFRPIGVWRSIRLAVR
jgi:predicted GNAT family acetyltransferase